MDESSDDASWKIWITDRKLQQQRKRSQLIAQMELLIDSFARKSGLSAEAHCRSIVSSIIQGHKQQDGYQYALQVALKLCFDYRIQDSTLVSELLSEVYHCDGSFERLLSGAIFGIRASYLTSNWKSDFASQEENIRAVEYFLEHSTKSRITFSNFRFADVPMKNSNLPPLKAASQVRNGPMMSLLSKFGAGFGEMQTGNRTLKALCKERICFLLWLNWKLPFGIFELPLPQLLLNYLSE